MLLSGRGLSWSYTTLVRMLADREYPGGVFGFQAPGILDELERATSITDSAARICEHVIGSMGFSRVALVGWSVGGVLAHEVATQLTQRGTEVEHAIVLDAYPATVWQQLPPRTIGSFGRGCWPWRVSLRIMSSLPPRLWRQCGRGAACLPSFRPPPWMGFEPW